ncbi:MAG TPA: hypothetical protein VJG32_09705 [Anaerolineae bacterium]|nr:hypothetical protein [Anaerolineae bacterium]
MNDYLTQLAAGALERLDVIRPRLPSRFETTHAPGAVHPLIVDETDIEAAPEQNPTVTQAPSAPPSPALPQTAQSVLRPAALDAARPHLSLQAENTIRQPSASEEQSIFTRSPGAPPPLLITDTQKPTSQPASAVSAPLTERARSSVLPKMTLAVVHPRTRADSAAKALEPVKQAAQPDAPPTIHVTIGRIDVCASLPPAPAPTRAKSTQPAPALSLSDYLRQKDERRR